MARLNWRHDESGDHLGWMYANIPQGLVVDPVTGENASRVWRWPIGRTGRWRVSLGLVAGPRGPKYQCSDLQVAVDTAELLVSGKLIDCVYGETGNGFCTTHEPSYHDRAEPICERCKQRPSEYSDLVRGEYVELCEMDHLIVEQELKDSALEDALLASLERRLG